MKYDSDTNSEASVDYVFESLSKEVTKISKSFTVQDKLLKKCIHDLDSNLEVSHKIQETVNEYLQATKASDLHLQKIISDRANDKENCSDYMKTENSSPKNNAVPSLFDEIGEIEAAVAPQKHDNAVLISEANLARINNLKIILEKLSKDIKQLNNTNKKHQKSQRFLVAEKGLRRTIPVFNF